MCKSVPQTPVLSTRISTSSLPIAGTGTSSNQRPGSARALTSAFILLPVGHLCPATVPLHPGSPLSHANATLSPRAGWLAVTQLQHSARRAGDGEGGGLAEVAYQTKRDLPGIRT